MSMRLGLGLGLTRRRRAAGSAPAIPAWEQLLALAAAVDSGAIVYDPDNPDTWTLRESGGTQFYSAVADGAEIAEAIVQATEANQPDQVTLASGRRVWARTGGSARSLLKATAFDPAIASPFTIIAAAKFGAASANQRIFDTHNLAGAATRIGVASGGNYFIESAGSNIQASGILPGTNWHVVHGVFNGASSVLYIDGLPDVSGTTGGGSLTSIGIMSNGSSTTVPLLAGGRVGPMIVIPGAHTPSDLSALYAHLNPNYGIRQWTGATFNLQFPGGWTWLNDPRAILYDTGKYAVGGIRGSNGNANVADIVNDVRSVSTVSAAFQVNDHANGAFLKRASDGKLLYFFSGHNAASFFVATSTNANDASAFGAPVDLDSELGHSNYSYAHVVQLASGRIYLFFRATNTTTGHWAYHYSYSDDDGANWITGVQISGDARPYHKIRKNGDDRIDIIVNDGHPNSVSTNGTYHFYLLDTGGTITFHGSDGTALGALPFDNTDWTQIYDASAAPRSWIHDLVIDGSGNPVVCFAVFESPTDHRYWQARWNGSAWSPHEICAAGGYLYAAEAYYSGGVITHPDDVDTVYTSRQVDANGDISTSGIFQIFKHTTTDSGETWSAGEQLTFEDAYCFRPYVPEGGSKLFFVKGRYTTYQNYNTTIEAMDI